LKQRCWRRCAQAKFNREFPSIFNDEKAIELVDQIDYDISAKIAALRLDFTKSDCGAIKGHR